MTIGQKMPLNCAVLWQFHVSFLFTYLLTYLIGHNNSFNGFWPVATHYTCSWSHQSLISVDPRIKYPTRRSNLFHTNNMAELTQPLVIKTLHNAYVIEELIQFTIESVAEIIANSHWTIGLFFQILSRLLHQCFIGSMQL